MVFGPIAPAKADIFEDAWGILTDPLKLDSSTQNVLEAVDRAAIHAERILMQTDGAIKERLAQIDKTVADTRADMLKMIGKAGDEARQVTDNAIAQLSQAQSKLFADTKDLVKCTTKVTLDQIQTELSNSLNTLGKRKPRLTFFGWFTILEAEIEPDDIKSPKESFDDLLDLYRAKLAEVTPETEARELTGLYGEIRRQAELTTCHYRPDSTDYDQLYQVELEFARRQKSWLGVVYPFGKEKI